MDIGTARDPQLALFAWNWFKCKENIVHTSDFTAAKTRGKARDSGSQHSIELRTIHSAAAAGIVQVLGCA